MSTYYYYGDTLYHHGIKGQKWGIRRFQNEDGSLTSAGREHYGYGVIGKSINAVGQIGNRRYSSSGKKIKYHRRDEKSFISEKSSIKKGVRVAAAVATGGTGRFVSRFAYNHRKGLRTADAILTGAAVGTNIALLGPAALPAVAVMAGKQLALHYASEKINDAMYENIYLKDKNTINKKYQNTKKYGND